MDGGGKALLTIVVLASAEQKPRFTVVCQYLAQWGRPFWKPVPYLPTTANLAVLSIGLGVFSDTVTKVMSSCHSCTTGNQWLNDGNSVGC